MESTYEEFINNILETRGRFACGDEYHERHHIVPRCMGGGNEKENLIDLFAREHFEAHRLLALENPENEKLVYAWWMMSHGVKRSYQDRYEITSKEYEEAKIAFSELHSGENHPMYGKRGELSPMYGKHLTKEAKDKISKSKIGKYKKENNSFYGKKHSKETREKMSKNHRDVSGEKHPLYGKHRSEETKKKLRDVNKGKHHSDETRKKMSESRKGKYHSVESKRKMSKNSAVKKKVLCLETGIIYESVTKASEFAKVSVSAIINCCKGNTKTSGNYHWKYIDEAEQNNTKKETTECFI